MEIIIRLQVSKPCTILPGERFEFRARPMAHQDGGEAAHLYLAFLASVSQISGRPIVIDLVEPPDRG
jgi:hypothetical protein